MRSLRCIKSVNQKISLRGTTFEVELEPRSVAQNLLAKHFGIVSDDGAAGPAPVKVLISVDGDKI